MFGLRVPELVDSVCMERTERMMMAILFMNACSVPVSAQMHGRCIEVSGLSHPPTQKLFFLHSTACCITLQLPAVPGGGRRAAGRPPLRARGGGDGRA